MSAPGKEVTRRRRSPRNVRAAAKILRREALKIVRRHAGRLSAPVVEEIRAAVAAMDAHRSAQNWEGLEDQAEAVDELLHQHASFARKSALRETIENVLVAVLVALGLRSCFYEPFKIPSGSMMPTLYAGDHIFVNKYVYGVQIPFTTTVVGKRFGEIERGDVIVFRYPLDESEDFIKRVVGVAGDEIRVHGHEVWIKRVGEGDFHEVPRERLDADCLDETGSKLVGDCTMYEETLDGKTYVVRYMTSALERAHLGQQDRVWKVPEGDLFVMGDNRSQSHDSTAWTVTVEAVSAESLLSVRDLRDLTPGELFTVNRPEKDSNDPKYDHVLYLNDRRAPEHDMALEVWRGPSLGARAVFETRGQLLPEAQKTSIHGLVEQARGLRRRTRRHFEKIDETVDELVVAEGEDGFDAVVLLESTEAVLQLHCGKAACPRRTRLARRIVDLVSTFLDDPTQDAREILEGDRAHRYGRTWTARGEPGAHFSDRVFSREGKKGRRSRVRLRAWRDPDEEIPWLRDAALRSLGSSRAEAEALPELGPDAWQVEDAAQVACVLVDETQRVILLLECGRDRCQTADQAQHLARTIASRATQPARDSSDFADLLRGTDVPGWEDVSPQEPDLAPFDRVTLEGTARDPAHTVDLRVWLGPEGGTEAKLESLAEADSGLEPDDRVRAGGRSAKHEGFVHLFAVPQSRSVVRLACGPGLCPDMAASIRLAQRVAEKAMDESTFVDPAAERSNPFVPRGNVKGRAERVWLPLERFWVPVR